MVLVTDKEVKEVWRGSLDVLDMLFSVVGPLKAELYIRYHACLPIVLHRTNSSSYVAKNSGPR